MAMSPIMIIRRSFMSMLKSKKIIIPVVAIAAILITLTAYNMQSVEVFTKVSFGEIVNLSDNKPSKTLNRQIASGSYTYYNNYDELDSRANLVLVGEVIKVNPPEELQISSNNETQVFTVSQFRVDKAIKGNIKRGDIVEVKQYGGNYNGVDYLESEAGSNYFQLGERHLLFLESYEECEWYSPCSLINPLQGNIIISNGKTKRTNNYQFINDSVPEDTLVKAIKEKVDKIKVEKEQEKELK